MVKGKITIAVSDRELLSEAISSVTYRMIPDSLSPLVMEKVAELEKMYLGIATLKGEQYMDLKFRMQDASANLIRILRTLYGIWNDKPGGANTCCQP